MYISSDSDDDDYGNIQQKLDKLSKRRNQAVIEKKSSHELINLCDVSWNGASSKDEVIVVPDSEDNDLDSGNLVLRQPIEPPEEITTKQLKRKKASSAIETPTKRGAKRGRGRGTKRGMGRSEVDTSIILESLSNTPKKSTKASLRSKKSIDNFAAPLTLKKTNPGRGRGRKRGTNSVTKSPVQISSSEASPVPNQASQDTGTSLDHQIALGLAYDVHSSSSHSNRGRGRRSVQNARSYIPTYSIGNTEEYPDASDNIKLFSSKPQAPASPIVDLSDSVNNEELSVKVFWQSTKVVKFNIRKLQKLTQIFDHFVKEEGVSREQLLFMYDNKILRPDDTPESMDYNIAKFIDGGIINSGVILPEAKKAEKPVTKGFKLKFQCQKLKRPYEVTVGKEEKLSLAMIKCAEHLELSMVNLRFEFDGETIKGNMTPKDLDMESGDCVDVKILCK